MKKLLLAFMLLLVLAPAALAASTELAPAQPPQPVVTLTATPTASTIYVNGEATFFEAYYFGGNNYFKLRDLAYALNGTDKQFAVGFNAVSGAITLSSGRAYLPVGGEMERGGTAQTVVAAKLKIYVDSKELTLAAYNINGNNFFMLRDIMRELDVYVGYDEETKAITLDTGKAYAER